jgi:sulfite reductase (NADPH) hemoprotein beta-component
MYRYDEFDHAFVEARVNQFSDQVARRLSGRGRVQAAAADERLYLQLHAYMLRVAIPYGTLNSRADAQARPYRPDLGQGLWPFHHAAEHPVQLAGALGCADILERTGRVEMHAIQTSGNCIRNVTADHFAGAAADEIADPRPYAEIRQWSTDHPEFSFLPRKFKIAVTGSRATTARRSRCTTSACSWCGRRSGRTRLRGLVGGGQGRTPMMAKKIRDFLPEGRSAALSGGDPAGLQSARPARQQVQGAHQDPGP